MAVVNGDGEPGILNCVAGGYFPAVAVIGARRVGQKKMGLGVLTATYAPAFQTFSPSMYGRMEKPQPAPCFDPTAGTPSRYVGG